MERRTFLQLGAGASLAAVFDGRLHAARAEEADVCIYGGTASGVMAALAAAGEGARVILIEPSRWLGGMTGGGLSAVDWGREQAVGGSTRPILKRAMDDRAYRETFAALLAGQAIPVIYQHRLASVQREGTTIKSLTLDHAPPDQFGCPAEQATTPAACRISARVFIDCSYEGDLMARAGVSYTFGREARETYGESLAGVEENLALYDIDPYVEPGHPQSGLLPLVQDLPRLPEGSADKLTMGYGFRWKFSTAADRLPIEPPDHYDPRTFELYRRAMQKGVNMAKGRRMRKLGHFEGEGGHLYQPGTGNLARALWAPTAYGSNASYPDGDYATRARLWKAEQDFLRGITHFLRTDPVVPKAMKTEAHAMGFQPGIFPETAGWPHQLYVREARRMTASYVLTQKDLAGETNPEDPVGLASYGVDEWPYATVVSEGKVALQGGYCSMLYLDQRHQGIYKIPYRAITPKPAECTNLLVPVCVSASHIAMTSIRMEPVWMILGESAGVAAALAVQGRCPVQQLEYAQLRTKLLALGQRLERPA